MCPVKREYFCNSMLGTSVRSWNCYEDCYGHKLYCVTVNKCRGAWRRVEARCRSSNPARVPVRALAGAISVCSWQTLYSLKMDLAPSGLPAVSRKKNIPESNLIYINPLLTKLVRSRWLDIGLVLPFQFMDLDFASVHKHANKRTWPISRHIDLTPVIIQ